MNMIDEDENEGETIFEDAYEEMTLFETPPMVVFEGTSSYKSASEEISSSSSSS